MFRTVIVPLDGSEHAERALPPAIELAAASGASIELVSVPAGGGEAAAHQLLESVAERLDGVTVRPPVVVPASDAAEVIANAAEQPGSIVVMSTHGRGGVARAVLGSVAEEVVRRSSGPVLLVGPDAANDRGVRGPVLVCSDGSEISDAVLPVAERWCRELGGSPVLLSIADPSVAPVGVVEGPASDVVEWGHVERVARDWSESGLPATWETVTERHPGEVIVDRATGAGAVLVAMGTHGRTGLARVALGSVAAHVAQHAPCPVLVVRASNLGD